MRLFRQFVSAVLLICGLGAIGGASAADAPARTAGSALAQDAVCTRCHNQEEIAPVLSIYQTKHGLRGDERTPTCQSCHGISDKHVLGDANVQGRAPPDVQFKKNGAFAQTDDKTRANQCLACHKGGQRNNWDGGQHQLNGLACNDCHKVHQPQDNLLNKKTQAEVCYGCHREQRADAKKISHHPIEEGKVVCSDCHNPHGSAGPTLLKKNTLNETCQSCHAEKRGPFLWEHQPATEDCANCHTPHGSNIKALLKSRPPFLCQECHDGPHNSQSPFAGVAAGIQGGLTSAAANGTVNPSSSANGRACMNCHAMVHGSNSPSGAFLHR